MTDDANPHGLPRPTIDTIRYESDDPDYQASINDTQVVQRIADWADEELAPAEAYQFLNTLRQAYEAIRPDNDWALDIN